MSQDEIDHLVAIGRWERVSRDVSRVRGSVPTWRQRLMVAVVTAGPQAMASHGSAAALWRIPGYPEGPVEVCRPRGGSRKGCTGCVHEVLRLPEAYRREVDDIPVASPELTVLQLCSRVRLDRAARLVDDALHRRLTTVPKLEVTLADLGRRGRPGVRRLRAVLAQLGDEYTPHESELEALLTAVLESAGIRAERQVCVGGTDAPIGRVDVLIRSARLVIEADGRAFHGSWAAIEADRRRDLALMAAGYTVMRVTWRQLVREPEPFLRAVLAVIHRTAA